MSEYINLLRYFECTFQQFCVPLLEEINTRIFGTLPCCLNPLLNSSPVLISQVDEIFVKKAGPNLDQKNSQSRCAICLQLSFLSGKEMGQDIAGHEDLFPAASPCGCWPCGNAKADI